MGLCRDLNDKPLISNDKWDRWEREEHRAENENIRVSKLYYYQESKCPNRATGSKGNFILKVLVGHHCLSPYIFQSQPLLFPYKVDNQVHYQKFCTLENFLLYCSLWSPLSSITCQGDPSWNQVSLITPPTAAPRGPTTHVVIVWAEEEALAQLGGWHGVPPPHAACLGPLARPDPRYIVSFFSFLRWQIAFLLDLSSSLMYALNAINFHLNTALIVSHTFW